MNAILKIVWLCLAAWLVVMAWGVVSVARADDIADLRMRVVQVEKRAIAAAGDMGRLQQDVKEILVLVKAVQADMSKHRERRPVYAADLAPIKADVADLRLWRGAMMIGISVLGSLLMLFIGLVMRGLMRGDFRISRKAADAQ